MHPSHCGPKLFVCATHCKSRKCFPPHSRHTRARPARRPPLRRPRMRVSPAPLRGVRLPGVRVLREVDLLDARRLEDGAVAQEQDRVCEDEEPERERDDGVDRAPYAERPDVELGVELDGEVGVDALFGVGEVRSRRCMRGDVR